MNSEQYMPPLTNPFPCDVYGKGLSHNQNLQDQRLIHSKGKPFSEHRHSQAVNMNLEQFGSLETSSYACDVYGINFPQNQHMQDPRLLHGGALPLDEQRNSQEVNMNAEQFIPTNPYGCGAYGKGYPQNQQSLAHHPIHVEERPFGCEKCAGRFSQKEELDLHRCSQSKHEEKHFICEVCDKRFASQYKLKSHLHVHSGERPFACDQCEKRFSCKTSLEYHLRRHAREKPFHCELCPQRFTSKTHLKKHQRVHTGERPYSCHVCQKPYANRESFLKHVRSHAAESDSSILKVSSGKNREATSREKGTTDERNPSTCDDGGNVAAENDQQCLSPYKFEPTRQRMHSRTVKMCAEKFNKASSQITAAEANSLTCDSDRKDLPENQNLKHHHLIHSETKTFDEQRHSRGVYISTGNCMPPETNPLSFTVCGKNILQNRCHQENSFVHSEVKTFPDQNYSQIGKISSRAVNRDVGNNVACDDYGKELQKNELMREHHQNDVMQFSCDSCEKKFNLEEELSIHHCIHANREFNSDAYKTEFTEKRVLEKHLLRRACEQTFACDVCGRRFSSLPNLTIHLRIHSGEKPFTCEVCEKKFISKERLRSHSVVHTQERRFACDTCEKRFLRKQDLNDHTLIHTGERPYACEVCEKKFARKQKLKNHLQVHTGARPFACDQCEKRFSCKTSLQYHLRRHAREKPFHCELCPQRFTSNTHLKKHQRVHTGERPYSCHVCQKPYANRESFLKHVRSHDSQNDSRTRKENHKQSDSQRRKGSIEESDSQTRKESCEQSDSQTRKESTERSDSQTEEETPKQSNSLTRKEDTEQSISQVVKTSTKHFCKNLSQVKAITTKTNLKTNDIDGEQVRWKLKFIDRYSRKRKGSIKFKDS